MKFEMPFRERLQRLWISFIGAPASWRYGIAVFGALFAILLRMALNPIWGSFYPYIFFAPVTLFVALLGGFGPGMTSVLLCAILGSIFIAPGHDFGNVLGQLIYLAAAVVIVWLAAGHRDLLQKSAAQTLELRDREETVRREADARRQAETALRRSEERYRTLVDATSTIVWVKGADGQVIEDVPGWRDFTGQTFDEIRGDGWISAIHPKDRERTAAAWAHAIGASTHYETQYRVRRRDGEYRHFSARGVPVMENDGAIREWIGACIDITERVRAEKAAAEYRSSLEAEVVERRRAEEALFHAQKMESIGQLTGGVAHDFNNMLTVIGGNLELLRRRLPDDSAVLRLADNALSAVTQATGITTQLLAFARSQRLAPEAVDVNRVACGMMDMLRRTVGERIEVKLNLAPDLWAAMADRHQFETALLNLVINARDAMPDGGSLTVVTGNATVEDGGQSDLTPGRYVALTVVDTGHGVAPELAPRIFEPFVTSKEVGKGTGLGLSMVYGFAKQSGGTVSFVSKVGRGAAFSIYLPYTEKAEPTPNTTPETAMNNGSYRAEELAGHRAILVVEDEPHVRALASTVLQELGYEVVEAADAAEALALFAQRPEIAMVFTDLVMPGRSGAELAVALLQQRPKMPVLLATGYMGALAEVDLPAGVEILLKPYRPADLARMMQFLLSAARRR